MKKKKELICLLLILVAIIGISLGIFFQHQNKNRKEEPITEEKESQEEIVEDEGKLSQEKSPGQQKVIASLEALENTSYRVYISYSQTSKDSTEGQYITVDHQKNIERMINNGSWENPTYDYYDLIDKKYYAQEKENYKISTLEEATIVEEFYSTFQSFLSFTSENIENGYLVTFDYEDSNNFIKRMNRLHYFKENPFPLNKKKDFKGIGVVEYYQDTLVSICIYPNENSYIEIYLDNIGKVEEFSLPNI